jgi:hypothetical protein
VAAVALVSRAAALGLAAHLGRDLTDAESGVRLLWPLTNREFKVAPWLYPVAVGALCGRSTASTGSRASFAKAGAPWRAS